MNIYKLDPACSFFSLLFLFCGFPTIQWTTTGALTKVSSRLGDIRGGEVVAGESLVGEFSLSSLKLKLFLLRESPPVKKQNQTKRRQMSLSECWPFCDADAGLCHRRSVSLQPLHSPLMTPFLYGLSCTCNTCTWQVFSHRGVQTRHQREFTSFQQRQFWPPGSYRTRVEVIT